MRKGLDYGVNVVKRRVFLEYHIPELYIFSFA